MSCQLTQFAQDMQIGQEPTSCGPHHAVLCCGENDNADAKAGSIALRVEPRAATRQMSHQESPWANVDSGATSLERKGNKLHDVGLLQSLNSKVVDPVNPIDVGYHTIVCCGENDTADAKAGAMALRVEPRAGARSFSIPGHQY